MAWAQEIIDFILKLKPWTTVEEYQTGLYFWRGKVLERRIPEKKLIETLERNRKYADKVLIEGKRKSLGIDEIRKLEEEVNKVYRETKFIPPEWHVYRGGRKELWLGHKRLAHPERYSKNIPYGVYFHIPEMLDLSRVPTMPAREVVKDLGTIVIMVKMHPETYILPETMPGLNIVGETSVPKTVAERETKSGDLIKYKIALLSIRPYIRYVIEDGYKAFTNVQDWQNTFHSQALVRISENTRGSFLEDWLEKDPVDKMAETARGNLNKVSARQDWGIRTEEMGFADIGRTSLSKNIQELSTSSEGLKLDIPKS
jgi:hypothetical protein